MEDPVSVKMRVMPLFRPTKPIDIVRPHRVRGWNPLWLLTHYTLYGWPPGAAFMYLECQQGWLQTLAGGPATYFPLPKAGDHTNFLLPVPACLDFSVGSTISRRRLCVRISY